LNRTFGLSVLLVAAEPDGAELARHHLVGARAGVHVTVASDERQALDFLCVQRAGESASLGVVSLLVLEIPAVGDAALAFVRRVRSDPALRRTPIVIVSGCEGTSRIEEAFELGANSVVTKPAERERRAALYRAIAEYWFDLNEGPSL